MFYLGSIITTRAIMVLSAAIISTAGGYYQVQSCDKIAYIRNVSTDAISMKYPGCANLGAGQDKNIAVPANMKSGLDEQLAAALGLSFGMALWISLFLHLIGVEIYLALTPARAECSEHQLREEIESRP